MFCLLSFPQRILLAASSLCIFQEAIWMHNKARKNSFIFSQWIFLYRCHLLNVFHLKCPIRPQGYTLLKARSHIISFALLPTWSTQVKTLDLCLFFWISAIVAPTEERKTIISLNGITISDTR